MKELILGGTRSGKSQLAEQHALGSGLDVVYLATAQVGDDEEMRDRILHHQRRRPEHWGLVEVGPDLSAALQQQAAPDRCLLVDCLTLWLTHLLWNESPERCREEQEKLLQVLPELPGTIIMVSNETSLGVIPMGEITRAFLDQAGFMHQQVAGLCDRVLFTVAGLPLVLKGELS